MNKRTVVAILGVLTAAGHWGCGGGSGPSAPTVVATPTPAPTPAPPVVLLQGNFALEADFFAILRTVTAPSSGVLEMTTDWTFARNDVDIVLARGSCTVAMIEADTCDIVAFTESLTAKPERLRINVTAGVYTPLVVNWGPDDESGAVQIVFTANATAAAASSRVWKPKGPMIAQRR